LPGFDVVDGGDHLDGGGREGYGDCCKEGQERAHRIAPIMSGLSQCDGFQRTDRDLEGLDPRIRRKVYSEMERLKRLSLNAVRAHCGCSWLDLKDLRAGFGFADLSRVCLLRPAFL
jgi:hypothetical protein